MTVKPDHWWLFASLVTSVPTGNNITRYKKSVISESASLTLALSDSSNTRQYHHLSLEGNKLSLSLQGVSVHARQLLSQQKVLDTISEHTNLPWGSLAGKDSQSLQWSMSNSQHKHISVSRGARSPSPMSSQLQQPAATSPKIRLKK